MIARRLTPQKPYLWRTTSNSWYLTDLWKFPSSETFPPWNFYAQTVLKAQIPTHKYPRIRNIYILKCYQIHRNSSHPNSPLIQKPQIPSNLLSPPLSHPPSRVHQPNRLGKKTPCTPLRQVQNRSTPEAPIHPTTPDRSVTSEKPMC